MSSEDLRVEELSLDNKGLKEFVKFPWKLYKNDPFWTPPLNGDLLGNRLLGLKGLLTSKHAYHKHAEVTHFMAWKGKKPVGRISAAVNRFFNEYHSTSMGFFGFFECINEYDVAKTLLDRACDWVKNKGMTSIRGPGEYSNATHERQGILIDGFEYQPTVELTHNPRYYQEFLERYGFYKAKDYVAYRIDKKTLNGQLIKRMGKMVISKDNVEIRPIDIKKLREEVRLIVQIYNECWAKNWGFLPLFAEEADSIADTLELIIDPGLVRFVYVDGKPAAVMGVIPDPNYALRPRWRWYGDSDLIRVIRLLFLRRKIPRLRGMFFGIKPEYRLSGLPALITADLVDYYMSKQYDEIDASLLLEDNTAILKVVQAYGGQYYKRWRIYDLQLK
jgi:hypothetical protein